MSLSHSLVATPSALIAISDVFLSCSSGAQQTFNILWSNIICAHPNESRLVSQEWPCYFDERHEDVLWPWQAEIIMKERNDLYVARLRLCCDGAVSDEEVDDDEGRVGLEFASLHPLPDLV